jgi:hypothetical protein
MADFIDHNATKNYGDLELGIVNLRKTQRMFVGAAPDQMLKVARAAAKSTVVT